MWEAFVIFNRIMLTDGLLLQIIVLSAALVWTLDDTGKYCLRKVAFAMLRIVGLAATLYALFAFFGALSLHLRVGGGPSIFFSLCVAAVSVVYAIFFSRHSVSVRMLICGELASSYITLTELGGALGRVTESAFGWESWIMRFICVVAIAVPAFFICRYHIGTFDELPVGGVMLTASVDVMCILIVMMGQIEGGVVFDYAGYIVQTHTMLYLIEILSYFIFYFICLERADRIRQQTEKELIAANRELVAISERTLSDMRQMRHDLKNHFAYMRMLIDSGDLEALDKYFTGVGAELQAPSSYVDCGNKSVSAIINMKKARAESLGYTFRTNVALPSELPFSDTDMCSILTNLLDNSLEAMEKYGIKEGGVDIVSTVTGDYLCFIVRNPLPADADRSAILSLLTSKNDKITHGLGTRIVKRLSAKYDGIALFDIKDDTFEAKVMLDLKH